MKKTNYSVSSVLAGAGMRLDTVRGEILEAIQIMAGDNKIELSEGIKVSLDNENVPAEVFFVSKDKIFAIPFGVLEEDEFDITDLKTDDLMLIANQMLMDVFPSDEKEVA